MDGIDFSQYKVVEELIQECDMETDRDHIRWIQETQPDAAVLLAEMHLLCKAAISDSIPLRNMSKQLSGQYYQQTNHKVHVFAASQALHNLGLDEREVARLFSQNSI